MRVRFRTFRPNPAGTKGSRAVTHGDSRRDRAMIAANEQMNPITTFGSSERAVTSRLKAGDGTQRAALLTRFNMSQMDNLVSRPHEVRLDHSAIIEVVARDLTEYVDMIAPDRTSCARP